MISPTRLQLAGWLAIIKAVFGFIVLILAIIIPAAVKHGWISDFDAEVAETIIAVVALALFVYVFSTLRDLLEERYAFYQTSGLITILIVASVVMAALCVLTPSPLTEVTDASLILLISLIPYGIIYIAFAIKLLRLPHNLHGMLKPFSYTAIASGFCCATIVLLPISLLIDVLSYIFLAIIFFRSIPEIAD